MSKPRKAAKRKILPQEAPWAEELQRLEGEANKLTQTLAGTSGEGEPSLHALLYSKLWQRDERRNYLYPEGANPACMWSDDWVYIAPRTEDLDPDLDARLVLEFEDWIEDTPELPLKNSRWLSSLNPPRKELVLPELIAAATPATLKVSALCAELEARLDLVDELKKKYLEAKQRAKQFAEDHIAPAVSEAVRACHAGRALKKARK